MNSSAPSTDFLTPTAYDEFEIGVGNPCGDHIFGAASPRVFNNAGYPYRATSLAGVARMVDSVNFFPSEFYYRQIGGLTEDEFEVVKRVLKSVAGLTRELYCQPAISLRGVFAAINMFRKIRAFCPDPEAPVLEIGGGNGYLGALLAAHGRKYVSTDVTQALYIYQSHVLRQLLGDRLVEAAGLDTANFDLDAAIKNHDAIHLPWWNFYTLFQKQFDFGVGIVVCNRALMEIGDTARLYCLDMARRLLMNHVKGRFLIFEDWGGREMTLSDYGAYQMHSIGYRFCHFDYQDLCVAVLRERSAGLEILDTPTDIGYRTHFPKRGEFPLPNAFEPYGPKSFKGPRIAQALDEFTQAHLDGKRVPLTEVEKFCKHELDVTEMRSTDEQFAIHIATVSNRD